MSELSGGRERSEQSGLSERTDERVAQYLRLDRLDSCLFQTTVQWPLLKDGSKSNMVMVVRKMVVMEGREVLVMVVVKVVVMDYTSK